MWVLYSHVRTQVALQAAEESAAALRLRVSEAGKRLAEAAELRGENAALQRRLEELGRERAARAALEAKIGKQKEEVLSFARWALLHFYRVLCYS